MASKVKTAVPTLAFLALLLALPLAAQEGDQLDPVLAASVPSMMALEDLPGISPTAVVVLPPPSNAKDPVFYRFSDPEDSRNPGPWLRFQRPLELGAALGEERTYVLDLRLPTGQMTSKTILVDRKAPGLPLASQESGLYVSDLRISLEAKDASEILYRIFSSEATDAAGGFQSCSPGAELELRMPRGRAATYVLLAYARDSAGNLGGLSTFEYRLAPEGLAYDSPPPRTPADFKVALLEDLPAPVASSTATSLLLEAQPPADKTLLVAVNPTPENLGRDDFVPVPTAGGRATLSFSWPLGWNGAFNLYFALEDESGNVEYREDPVSYAAGAESLAEVAPPAPPVLTEGKEGRVGILTFPSYDGLIALSLNDADFGPWTGPLSLEPSDDPIRVAWYGVDASGRRSANRSLSLRIPKALDRTVLLGIPTDKVVGKAVSLASDGPGLIHYEISNDLGQAPLEPRADSPSLADPLVLDAAPGTRKAFYVRYRAFDKEGQALDEGGSLSVTVDREPPAPPTLAAEVPAYSPEMVSLSWTVPEGRVMAAVDVDGVPGDFRPVTGPLVLEGSVEAPVRYTVRAYAVDPVGNQSPPTSPRDLVVDRAVIYVAASAQAGDGSRARPFASLDEALDLAASEARLRGASARKILWVGPGAGLNAPHRLEGRSLTIQGGFDQAWKAGAGDSRILVGPLPGSQSPLVLAGTTLRISNCDFVIPQLAGSLCRISGGSLALTATSFRAASQGDLLLFDADGSRLDFSLVDILIEGGASASVLTAKDSDLSLTASTVEAGPKVSYFLGFSLEGGSLGLSTTRVTGAASLGTRLLEVRGGRVALDRASLAIKGSGGFASFGSFSDAPGYVRNTRVVLGWEGSATLFSIRGQGPAFSQDSIYAQTSRGSLRAFDCGDLVPPVRNSIVVLGGEASVFVASTTAPRSGDLGPNDLWGCKVLVSGALSLRDLGALNEYNRKASPTTFLPSISEDPQKTWGADAPGTFALGVSSLCRGAGAALPGLATDFSGYPRPTDGRVDLGADQAKR